MTIGSVAAAVTFENDHTLTATSAALPPGSVNDVVVTTPDGTDRDADQRMGRPTSWTCPEASSSTRSSRRSSRTRITVGVGGGNYGVDQPTLRQQMAVFLMKAKHGLCYVAAAVHDRDLHRRPLLLRLRPLDLRARRRGHHRRLRRRTTYCPTDPVKRQQMAVLLLRTPRGRRLRPAGLRHGDLRRRALRQPLRPLDLRPRRPQHHRRLRRRPLLPDRPDHARPDGRVRHKTFGLQ